MQSLESQQVSLVFPGPKNRDVGQTLDARGPTWHSWCVAVVFSVWFLPRLAAAVALGKGSRTRGCLWAQSLLALPSKSSEGGCATLVDPCWTHMWMLSIHCSPSWMARPSQRGEGSASNMGVCVLQGTWCLVVLKENQTGKSFILGVPQKRRAMTMILVLRCPTTPFDLFRP